MNNPPTFLIVIGVLLLLGAGIGIFFWRRRVGYIKSLTDRGWAFESSPTLAIANGLNVPPFGLGFDRSTDEHIAGARSGVPFQVFEYKSQVGRFRVAAMRLQLPLPELFVTTAGARPGAQAAQQPSTGQWHVLCDDPGFARAFQSAAGAAVTAFAQANAGIDLSVDGDQLVILGAPKDAAELERYLDLMAEIARALEPGALASFRRPAPEPWVGFYRRPHWRFRDRDDALMNVVEVTRGGQNHRIVNVVSCDVGPLPFVAFKHHWQTTRTVTSTDANGNTTTRTETDNHEESIFEMSLGIPTPYLEVTGNRVLGKWFGRGERVESELAAFNERFDVRSTVPKFASDVIHPRQIEYLMQTQPAPFSIEGGRIRVDVPEHDLRVIDHTVAVLLGFLVRIPEFVWQDLGVAVPDFDGDGRPGPTLYSSAT
ncbi:hypothetical protein EXU48_18670 [Occultella glacieicola]|uniref:DUF2125 domain-containing protein n=1 Tax=Occultella glacieicola TaxID=2518684 RepID=A0ABY2E0B7_9MICO|nr:hypothetical protein [Occultella glacieicola]TDE89954.1 hypothetical protein EXU48_18670 [Occultella glacieicola]